MQISRRDLYNRAWSTPMSKLARELDISDVGLAKACRRHNIPRPPRGYWAKLAAGKAPPKPALPSSKIDTVELNAARHRIAETPKVEVDRAEPASRPRKQRRARLWQEWLPRPSSD